MDLDALSGIIVYNTLARASQPLLLGSTASPSPTRSPRSATWEYSPDRVTHATGRSSVEITCKVARARPEGQPNKPEDVLLTCAFTMGIAGAGHQEAGSVPKLICSTPEEGALQGRRGQVAVEEEGAEDVPARAGAG